MDFWYLRPEDINILILIKTLNNQQNIFNRHNMPWFVNDLSVFTNTVKMNIQNLK